MGSKRRWLPGGRWRDRSMVREVAGIVAGVRLRIVRRVCVRAAEGMQAWRSGLMSGAVYQVKVVVVCWCVESEGVRKGPRGRR